MDSTSNQRIHRQEPSHRRIVVPLLHVRQPGRTILLVPRKPHRIVGWLADNRGQSAF